MVKIRNLFLYESLKIEDTNFRVIAQSHVEFIILCKVEELNACIRPLFTNPAIYNYKEWFLKVDQYIVAMYIMK